MKRNHYILLECNEHWLESMRFVLEQGDYEFDLIDAHAPHFELNTEANVIALMPLDIEVREIQNLVKLIRNQTGQDAYLAGISEQGDTELCQKKSDLFDLIHKGSLSPSDALDLLFTINSEIDLKVSLNSWKIPISEAKLTLYQQAKQVRDIQVNLMPKQGQDFSGLRTYLVSKPLFMVSGDHFSAHQIDENHVAFYLIDVVGHGITSGVKSLGIARLLSPDHTEGIIRRINPNSGQRALLEPHEVMKKLNSLYKISDSNDTYFSGVYGFYNQSSRQVSLCVAGVPSVLILNEAGQSRKIDANDVPIGLFERHNYQTTSFTINPKDRLFLFSDGLPEAMTRNYEMFTEDRILECIQQHSQSHTLKILNEIIFEVSRWCGRDIMEFEDDISAFCLEFDPLPQNNEALKAFERLTPDNTDTLTELNEQILNETQNLGANPTVIIFKNDVASENEIKGLRKFCSRLNLNTEIYGREDSITQIDSDRLSHASCVVFMEGTTVSDKLKCLLILENNLTFNQLPMVLDLSADENIEDVQFRIKNLTDFYLKVSHRKDLAYWLKKVRSLSAKYLRLAKRNLKANQFLAAFDQDLKSVANLQSVLLRRCRRSRSAFSTHYVYRPGNMVSGDFIGVFRLTKHIFALTVIDTYGQGILSATQGWAIYRMLSGLGNNSLTLTRSTKDQKDPIPTLPSKLLEKLNEKTIENKDAGNPTFSITYALLDERTGDLTLSSAGAPASLVYRLSGEEEQIDTGSPRLGLSESPGYSDYSTRLKPGDKLLLATDGLYIATGHDLKNPSIKHDFQKIFAALKMRDPKKMEQILNNMIKNQRETQQKDAAALILNFLNPDLLPKPTKTNKDQTTSSETAI